MDAEVRFVNRANAVVPSFEFVMSIWPKPCFVCGTPTQVIEINYMGHLCSDECDRKAAEDAKAAGHVR